MLYVYVFQTHLEYVAKIVDCYSEIVRTYRRRTENELLDIVDWYISKKDMDYKIIDKKGDTDG